jgi:hypothetical protein
MWLVVCERGGRLGCGRGFALGAGGSRGLLQAGAVYASVRVVRVMAAGYPEAGRARAGFRGIRERGIRGRWWWAAVVVGGRARAGVWVSGRARGVVGAAERARRDPREARRARRESRRGWSGRARAESADAARRRRNRDVAGVRGRACRETGAGAVYIWPLIVSRDEGGLCTWLLTYYQDIRAKLAYTQCRTSINKLKHRWKLGKMKKKGNRNHPSFEMEPESYLS